MNRRGSTLVNLIFTIAVLAGLAGGGYAAWVYWLHPSATGTFRTATVERTDLMASITATGTIQPEDAIDVGVRVDAMIKAFGTDPRKPSNLIDFGTHVEEGTLLAQLDDAVFAAELASASANEARAQADLKQMDAKVRQTERDWGRAQTLRPRNVISELDYDTSLNAYETAKATLEVGKANLKQAEATRKMAEINMGYTVIRSPVKGIIIDRRVNIGQTVKSSLNAPSLFLIAKDLKRLQVWASVNEADIGQIYLGQKVKFNVDAHPGRDFQGTVTQKRLNATMTQNVVTYTVVVTTDNPSSAEHPEGMLVPYLTANLQFEVKGSRREGVLAVPNAALRFKPQASQIALDARNAPPSRNRSKEKDPSKEKTGTIWAEDGGFVRPIRVTLGTSDGTLTEVSGDGVSEGVTLVVGSVGATADAGGGASNPFLPSVGSGGGGRR